MQTLSRIHRNKMGRIKNKLLKRVTHKLVAKHRAELKTTFDENKTMVEKFAKFPSKKVRNVVAGYVTRLMNVKKDF